MERILLKNGWIVDGSGRDRFQGDVLIEGKKIKTVSSFPLSGEGARILDCEGLVVAPGFIDGHSHQDHFFAVDDPHPFFDSFLEQGITTFLCGNCGFGMAGFQKGSPYKQEIAKGFLANALRDVEVSWDTWPEYEQVMEQKGMLANMAKLAAHGAALGSVIGPGTPDASALTGQVKAEVLEILEEGLLDGCKGISLGLAYRPGNFMTDEEIHQTAALAAKHGKLLTVHRKVETALSGAYADFDEPHNVRWLRSFFDIIKDTGVKVHISHLIYPGRSTFPSYEAMHQLLETYRAAGLNVTYDMYSYEYGATEIAILLAADIPLVLDRIRTDRAYHDLREAESLKTAELAGIHESDVILSNPYVPELEPYKGMNFHDMAKVRGLSGFDNKLDILERTNGHATILLSPYYTTEMIVRQMQDPLCHYMTDAWIDPGCTQNPAAYGGMPRFLRLAREKTGMRLEDVVHKMTGKTARRFDLGRRGLLKNGYYADITVFDPEKVCETATPEHTQGKPKGIACVMVNGQIVVERGQVKDVRAGMSI